MKFFETSNIEIINECRNFFGIGLPSVHPVKGFDKFLCNADLLSE